MSELEEKLGALLSNPQLMQQIASMAQSMNKQEATTQAPSQPNFDPKLIQTLAQTMGQAGIDSNQSTLLHALSPYLSPYRVQKLERAMQASRMAGAASAFLNAGGLQLLRGR